MFVVNPVLAIDFYKSGHIYQYPDGTENVYSTFIPRSDRLATKTDEAGPYRVVPFGVQAFVKGFLIDAFNEYFFKQPLAVVLEEYSRIMDGCLGPGLVGTKHIEDLWKLGYLPLVIQAIPEGTPVPIGTPLVTIINSNDRFYWLPNYIESVMSAELWKPTNSATIALQFRKVFEKYCKLTGGDKSFVKWQGHDFSFRGNSGMYDACSSGGGHLTSFYGTDTIPAILWVEHFYNAKGTLVGGSVPATEHSVMSAGGKDNETETIRRIVTKIVPSGVVSVVSDTWDYWDTVWNRARVLKQEILDRKPNALGLAKVVFRPDSGDPEKIICGDPDYNSQSDPHWRTNAIQMGSLYCLEKIFGSTENKEGYYSLNPRVGLIYGDSITLQRQVSILQAMKKEYWCSSNIVFGIGSFTYQYQTRDSNGMAVKSSAVIQNGVIKEITKDPKTDNGVKKSRAGFLFVDPVTLETTETLDIYKAYSKENLLRKVFEDGVLVVDEDFETIRARIDKNVEEFLETV